MIRIGQTVYFACDECPIVCQLERRLSIAEEYGFQFDHCGCEKVDAQFYAGGYCEDAFYYFTPQRSRGHRKYGRAYRRAMNAKRGISGLRLRPADIPVFILDMWIGTMLTEYGVRLGSM